MLRRALQQLGGAGVAARLPLGASVRRFASVNGNQVRAGMALDLDGRIYRVTKAQNVKPGKGGAYTQVELKEIKTGTKTNRRFRAAESVQKAPLGPDQYFQFLYQQGANLVLMHNGSFEQMEVPSDLFSERQMEFLLEGMTLALQIVDGDVLWAHMPEHVTLTVAKTTAKGVADTALSMKDATLENGAVVKVPLFIEAGHQVRITTEDGAYVDKL
ncbi:hypothetical protein PybrP1_001111 [[Pythium] brassicae (nom. inval.)]|nr:hypothetical protein PybrP1_001111 [[Pythium] brassicae (nom. inval.)]